jgi:prepilin-type N-terminal cleavage/methylation domain-containing protein
MRHDNRGLSLVEIMVVVAIMAVVTGVGVMGINSMTGRPAQQCVQKIAYSLERHRTSAMGKADAKYVLRVDSSTGKIVCDEYFSNSASGFGTPTTSEVGGSKITVTYECKDGTTHLLADEPLTIIFDRSTGAFKASVGGSYCTKITAARGGREYSITLVPVTGKVYID